MALNGTWVIVELPLSVLKEYRILLIREVYEYKVPGTTPKLRRVVCLLAI